MYFYSITIKCNQKGKGETISQIGDVFLDLLRKTSSESLLYTFEKDSHEKNHLHGYFRSNNKLIYKDLRVKGWNIYIRRVYEHTGWYNYLMKDLKNHAQDFGWESAEASIPKTPP